MLTILVNLDSAEERRACMKAQLAAAGIEAERIGIDFRGSTDEDVHRWMRAHFPHLDFDLDTMCTAEAGCWASHVSAWWRLAHSQEPSCRVIEDDVLLAPDFPHATEALRTQHAFDVIYL